MLLKAYNRQLIEDREKTHLTAAVAAGGTTLTVAGVNADVGSDSLWADNTYIIVGEIGTATAEVLQMAAAASDGTSLTIDQLGAGGCRFAHAIGEPVYRIDYNRVEFNRNTTNSTSGVSVLATQLIQADDEYTRYEDTTNTTGYGFIRFNNQTSGAFSSYSDGVNYEAAGASSSYDARTLWALRKRTRALIDEVRPASKVTDDQIREALNDKQRDIAHQRLWSFYEIERSFAAAANQLAYNLPETIHKIYGVKFRTEPLIYANKTTWDILHFNTNQTSRTPSHFHIWNRQMLLWPRPSTAAATTTLGAALSAGATSATVVATSGFLRGDFFRFIIDSEVITAQGSTSTTFTVLTRGAEGTTDAAHTNTTTVTERDIVYTASVEPTDLFDAYDRTAIPEPEVLAHGAAADLALLLGKQDLHDRLLGKFERGLKELESKYAQKQISQFGRVKDASETLRGAGISRLNPNLYPQSITGT